MPSPWQGSGLQAQRAEWTLMLPMGSSAEEMEMDQCGVET